MKAMEEQGRHGNGHADRGFVSPPVNIFATDDEYLLEVDMPGVTREGLEILLEGTQLTITGRRQSAPEEGELCYCESDQGDFRRTFELAADVDRDKVSAVMDQGVLKLRLPIADRVKPKRIPIG